MRAAFSPDGHTLAVSLNDAGQPVLFDASSAKPRASIPAGGRPDGIVFSPDGRCLYVVVTRTCEARIVAGIDVGDGPSGLLIRG